MIAWFAANLLWASAAMLVVLAIRRPVARWFGAGVAYALWLIPALRLVAPPAEWVGSLFDAPLPALPGLFVMVDEAGGAAAAPLDQFNWIAALLVIWVTGALLFMAVQALCYRRFLTGLSGSMRSVGSHRGVPLIASDAVEGPLALGLLDRRIVVPAEFEIRYSASERILALDHERYHHRRGDILANHVALIILALNWFNPVAWAAFRAFRADQEMSCDAAIAAAAPAEARCDYARALVKSASRPGLIAACPLNHADQLKRRLKMLNHHRKDRRRLWAGSAVTATLIAASLTLGAPSYAQDPAKESTKERRERVIIMEHRDGAGAAGEPGAAARHRGPLPEARMRECESQGDQIANIEEGTGDHRVRIMLCAKGDGAPADRLTALQRARERIAGNDEIPADAKQRVLAQLDQAIARARAQ